MATVQSVHIGARWRLANTNMSRNGISIGSAALARLTGVPSTHTDRGMCDACGSIGRINAMHAMRPKTRAFSTTNVTPKLQK